MRSLAEVRADIDRVDDALVPLVAERTRLSGEARAVKEATGAGRHDPDRERVIVAKYGEEGSASREVGRRIVDACRTFA